MQPRRLEEELFQDIRYGVRTMLQSKGWTVVVMLSLAIGIGANTALFSAIERPSAEKAAGRQSGRACQFPIRGPERHGYGSKRLRRH